MNLESGKSESVMFDRYGGNTPTRTKLSRCHLTAHDSRTEHMYQDKSHDHHTTNNCHYSLYFLYTQTHSES